MTKDKEVLAFMSGPRTCVEFRYLDELTDLQKETLEKQAERDGLVVKIMPLSKAQKKIGKRK